MKTKKEHLNMPRVYLKRYPRATFYTYCAVTLLLVSTILYLRFPNNYLHPNFFAEDGRVFMANVLNRGFIDSIFITFNGYFTVNLYLLTGLAYVCNLVFFQGHFTSLPVSVALVGYSSFAVCICAPAFIFKKQLGYLWMTILIIVSSFIPLTSSDYAILGSIGNLKWLFFYLAFVMTIYRIINYKKSTLYLLGVDIIFLSCAYTNTTVYFLYPLFFIPYLVDILHSKNRKKTFQQFIHNKKVYQIFLVGLLLLPQLIYIKIHGIPSLPGYLDTPYELAKTPEIFGWRIFLFQYLYPFMKVFSTRLTIAFLLAVIIFLITFTQKKYRIIVLSGLYAVFISTLLFVVKRPGISDSFLGYKTSGPDQFFFAQNLIMWLLLIFVLAQIKMSNGLKIVITGSMILMIIVSLPLVSTYGNNDFMAKNAGTINKNVVESCAKSSGEDVSVQIYPEKGDTWRITSKRSIVCGNEK